MSKKYKVMVGNDCVATVDQPMNHGEIIEHMANKLFVYYTKGKCIFTKMLSDC